MFVKKSTAIAKVTAKRKVKVIAKISFKKSKVKFKINKILPIKSKESWKGHKKRNYLYPNNN